MASRDGVPGGEINCGLLQKGNHKPSTVANLATVGALLVYTTDVFIPLIELREEIKCDIGELRGTPEPWRPLDLTAYQLLKAIDDRTHVRFTAVFGTPLAFGPPASPTAPIYASSNVDEHG